MKKPTSGAKAHRTSSPVTARVKLVPFPFVFVYRFFRQFLEFTPPRRARRILCFSSALLCASVVNCFALDREAFSITNYDLNVRVEPEQHRLGVRGKITLRNDTQSPQRIAVLQISSSLDWKSIRAGDKAVQFVMQPLTSDIDHTEALSEAIVTLPQPVAPQGTIELEIGYEGIIVQDATRLTRIGTPEDAAHSIDWDQIDANFTGVRGAGYVAWYPIATEVANLSEGDLFEVLDRWKAREAGAATRVRVTVNRLESRLPQILFGGSPCAIIALEHSSPQLMEADCLAQKLRLDSPTLVVAGYQTLERPQIEVRFLKGHDAAAATSADAAENIAPFITEWFGPQREKAKTADLPDPSAAPFESGILLLTPLASTDAKLAGLAAAHQLTHASFLSFRPWINEGLAHFAQALYLEHEHNRQSALVYMGLHRSAFIEAEKAADQSRPADDATHSLISTTSEELYRSKAMCVWWMLRDMIGDAALKKAFATYRPEDDNEASYMPRLIEAQTPRDLEWFFDNWVYHDRGLPDFKIESVFPAKTATGTHMVTVTVDNLGTAGAEVPVIIKSEGVDVVKRIEVRAKSKVTVRVESPARPTEVVVNDGSVPESDMTNNVFKLAAPND
jgi:hypothetical protein